MKRMLFLLALLVSFPAFCQPTQTVRGTVVDSETQYPLLGVKIQVKTADSTQLFRALTQENGSFSIKNVPVGKHELIASFLTYDTRTITIEVSSGKETIVKVPLQESFIEKEEVIVTGRNNWVESAVLT